MNHAAAGHLFVCVCCNESCPELEASFDRELEGPVCQMCKTNLEMAKVYLAKKQIYPITHNSNNRIIQK